MRQLFGMAVASLALITAGRAQAGSGSSVLTRDDPHAFFPLSATSTLDRIEQECARRDEPVRARKDDAVTCEVTMGLAERIAARVLLREPFARSLRAFLRFTAVPSEPGFTRVDVTGSVEDARPAPHRRVESLAGARFARHGQELLENLGGSLRPF